MYTKNLVQIWLSIPPQTNLCKYKYVVQCGTPVSTTLNNQAFSEDYNTHKHIATKKGYFSKILDKILFKKTH